jgi:hypothetical protein
MTTNIDLRDEAITVADYEEVLADKRRLTKELDVAIFGDGGATGPALCDVLGSVRRECRERGVSHLMAAVDGHPNAGAFRMGARAMRKDLADRLFTIPEVHARVIDFPLPTYTPPEPRGEAAWGWWAGSSEEFFDYGGPCKTREDAIADGRSNADGEAFFITEAVTADYRFCATRVIDDMIENAEVIYEDCAEVVGPKDEVDAATAELQALLDGWLARHSRLFSTPTLFAGTRNLEHIAGQCPDCEAECGDVCPAAEVEEEA